MYVWGGKKGWSDEGEIARDSRGSRGTHLAATDKEDRLTRHVGHGERRSYLVVLRGETRDEREVSEGRHPAASRQGGLTMVSNFVKIIPSTPLCSAPAVADEKSRRLRSNFESWSTASFPTSASPTKTILSGVLTVTSLDSARISGSLSCIRPAVSIRTTSNACSLAERRPMRGRVSLAQMGGRMAAG